MPHKIIRITAILILMLVSVFAYALIYTPKDLDEALTFLNSKEKILSKKLNYRYLETSISEIRAIEKLSKACVEVEKKKLSSVEGALTTSNVDVSQKTIFHLETQQGQTINRMEMCTLLVEKSKKLIILAEEQMIEAKEYKESGRYRMNLLEVLASPTLWNDKVDWKPISEIFSNEIYVINQYPFVYWIVGLIGFILGLFMIYYMKNHYVHLKFSRWDWMSIPILFGLFTFYVFLKYETNHFLVQPKLNNLIEGIMIYLIMSISGQILIKQFYQHHSQKILKHLNSIFLFFLRSLLVFSLINFIFADAIHITPKGELYNLIAFIISGIYFPVLGVYLIKEFLQVKLFKKNQHQKIKWLCQWLMFLWCSYFVVRYFIIFSGYQWFTTLQLVFVIFLFIYSIILMRYFSNLEKSIQFGHQPLAKKMHKYCQVELGKTIYELTGILYIINILILYTVLIVILDILSVPPYFIATIQRLVWEGFKIGSAHIIPINFIFFLLILILGSLLGKYICYIFLQRKLKTKSLDLDRQMTLVIFIKYISISISLLIGLLVLGLSSSEMSVIIGGIGVGLGMGLRDLVMDFIAGMLLLFQKTIHIGDYVSIDNNMYSGQVLKIMPLSMQILLSDHTTMYIPNSYVLKYSFTNHSSANQIETCFFLFKIKNLTNLPKIKKIILNYLDTQNDVLMNSPYQPQLNILNMQNWEHDQNYDTLHLQFHLRKDSDKSMIIAQIKIDLNHRLKNYLAE
jgi:small-conductance mechanosensitive channel